MSYDARVGAFIGALDRIEIAQKMKVDRHGETPEVLPELYWATIAEAAVLAQLSSCPAGRRPLRGHSHRGTSRPQNRTPPENRNGSR